MSAKPVKENKLQRAKRLGKLVIKPKIPTINITEAPKKKRLVIKEIDKPTPYKPTVKKLKIGKEPAKPKAPAKPKVNKFEEIDEEIEKQFGRFKEYEDVDRGAGAGAGTGADMFQNQRKGQYKQFLAYELGKTTGDGGGQVKERTDSRGGRLVSGGIPKGYANEIYKQLVDEIKKQYPVGSKTSNPDIIVKKYTKDGVVVEGFGKKRTYLFKNLKKGRGSTPEGNWINFF